MFRKPTAQQLAKRELEETERLLMAAHDEVEWAQARVQCYEQRIARLRALLPKEGV